MKKTLWSLLGFLGMAVSLFLANPVSVLAMGDSPITVISHALCSDTSAD